MTYISRQQKWWNNNRILLEKYAQVIVTESNCWPISSILAECWKTITCTFSFCFIKWNLIIFPLYQPSPVSCIKPAPAEHQHYYWVPVGGLVRVGASFHRLWIDVLACLSACRLFTKEGSRPFPFYFQLISMKRTWTRVSSSNNVSTDPNELHIVAYLLHWI